MRRYDLDWIIILFFIYLNAFIVETIGGISLQGHFNGAILRHQMTFFGVKIFFALAQTP
jgi:hypothetical protein